MLIALALALITNAHAELRLDCSDLTPKQIKILKAVPAQDTCTSLGTSIVATTHDGILYTCVNGKTLESYDISIGRGGVGKTKAGDLKTPLGTYALGSPRASDRFGLFIPVGYPTKSQRAQGLSGADVGIHGPDRLFACAGALNVSVNWTQGCLALADDRFLVSVATFVKSHKAVVIHILN